MTDTPNAPITSAVTFGGQVGQRPDGKHVVVLVIATDNCSFQFALPPDAALEAGAKLGPLVTELAEQARRSDTGLLVANSVPARNGGKIR